jgi:hypothetical protein
MCYDYYQKGFKVYANIDFNFPYEKLNYADIINCKLHDAVVFMDEAHLILPARSSMKSSSKHIVDNFISMSSKANLICIFATQYPNKIDSRISQLEKDYNVLAEKYIFNGERWIRTNKDAKELGDTPTIIEVTIEQVYDHTISKLRLWANAYYNLYNRYEIVNIEGLEEADEIRKAKLKHLKQKAVDRLKDSGEIDDE